MSSVSAVGGSNSDLVRLFQQYAQRLSGETTRTDAAGSSGQARQAVGDGSAPPEPPPMDESRQAEFISNIVAATEESGADAESLEGLEEAIQAAIDDATQDADGSTDPRQSVQEAIDGVLEERGVDLEAFREKLQARMGPPPGGHPPQAPQGSDDAQSVSRIGSGYYAQLASSSSQLLANMVSLLDEIA